MRTRTPSRKTTLTALLLILAIHIACAAGPNVLTGTPAADGSIAGFWIGLWHGVILPFSFIVSLLNHAVHIYEVHNNGGWYNFGFVIGVAIVFGGGGNSL
jgi:hypothetical protein